MATATVTTRSGTYPTTSLLSIARAAKEFNLSRTGLISWVDGRGRGRGYRLPTYEVSGSPHLIREELAMWLQSTASEDGDQQAMPEPEPMTLEQLQALADRLNAELHRRSCET